MNFCSIINEEIEVFQGSSYVVICPSNTDCNKSQKGHSEALLYGTVNWQPKTIFIAADTNGIAVAIRELFAAFVAFQRH